MQPLTLTLSVSQAPVACRLLAGSQSRPRPALRNSQASDSVRRYPRVPPMDIFRSAITGLL